MAIQLYRKGSTHTVRGIDCEVGNFSIASMPALLNDGWFSLPEDIENDEQIEEAQENDEENAEKEEGKDEKEDAQKALNPVRQAAKNAGIVGWEKKRIKTLEGELGA